MEVIPVFTKAHLSHSASSFIEGLTIVPACSRRGLKGLYKQSAAEVEMRKLSTMGRRCPKGPWLVGTNLQWALPLLSAGALWDVGSAQSNRWRMMGTMCEERGDILPYPQFPARGLRQKYESRSEKNGEKVAN